MDVVNLHELEALARDRLPPGTFDYCAGGAADEVTLRENVRAYSELALRPRVCVDVGGRSVATTILGAPHPSPILVAPMAFQRMVHRDAEVATARGAGRAGAAMVLSTFASATADEVRRAASTPLWYQLYVFKDRGASRAVVERAESTGYEALVLTVDAPMLGRRERDLRNRFDHPAGVPNAPTSIPPAGSALPVPDAPTSGLALHFAYTVDASLSWRDVEWLRGITRLPLLVKGILRGDDAARAVERGAAGVIVSNHGGRQLDTALATIRALPEVADAVAGRADVLVDGGVRRGTDVIKALALGARGVLVGRPVLWGLALAGEDGVAHALSLLREELDLAMALCGCTRVADVTRDLVAA